MRLAQGAKLGPYEILAPLGAGAMGEVYRGRDHRLQRDVALKVLPDAFARDSERLARFRLEARILASLSHPNIAAIHGLEESNGVRALVMELAGGRTLAERLARGPVEIDEALRFARQLAEALEYAHEKGVIHCDLKPANVKITSEGTVKLLDFGLAKALLAQDSDSEETATLISNIGMGSIAGTPAYMPPELLRDNWVDRRGDIWAFGVVLFEMLAGKRPFAGKTVSESVTATLTADPNWSALPADAPEAVRALLRRCLRKDPKSRLRDIGDARVAIEEYLANSTEGRIESAPSGRRSHAFAWISAGLLLVTAVLAGGWWRASRPVPRPLARLTVVSGSVLNGTAQLWAGTWAISRDATRIVLVSVDANGTSRLALRLLDRAEPVLLAGTENARNPFFSPDGQWIGFFATGRLKKISVEGGTPVVICDVPDDRGGSWGDDGQIVFAANPQGGLWRVSSEVGTPAQLTTLDLSAGEMTHRWPQVLPGSRAVVFTVNTTLIDYDTASVQAQSLPTGSRRVLVRGGYYGRYVASGHLLYMHSDSLFAAPMSGQGLAITGVSTPVLDGILANTINGVGAFDAADNGTLVFLNGINPTARRTISWLDAAGHLQPVRTEPGAYRGLRISPDGRRLAFSLRTEGKPDIWVLDATRDVMTRVTFAPGGNESPVWAPDGTHLAFASNRDGRWQTYWARADGSGEAVPLTAKDHPIYPASFSSDGKWLTVVELDRSTSANISIIPIQDPASDRPGAGDVQPFLNAPYVENSPRFSPDGRWIAYITSEQGKGTMAVYVRAFPDRGSKWQISTDGGSLPIWSPDRRTLFYLRGNTIMAVDYTVVNGGFSPGRPRVWSEQKIAAGDVYPDFDMAPDGKKAAVILRPQDAPEPERRLDILLNFFDELRREIPSGQK